MTSDISPEVGPEPGAWALASRRNGASSRGPKTVAGRARSSRNPLKHGLRAPAGAARRRGRERVPRLPSRGAGGARARRGAALRGDLGGRRWEPAALEAALLGRYLGADALHAGDAQEALGTGLIRDGNGPRALETLVRYRGSVLAELFRALAALKLLQAESREFPESTAPDAAPAILPPPRATTERTRESRLDQSLGRDRRVRRPVLAVMREPGQRWAKKLSIWRRCQTPDRSWKPRWPPLLGSSGVSWGSLAHLRAR
jgi:hypothetical protein